MNLDYRAKSRRRIKHLRILTRSGGTGTAVRNTIVSTRGQSNLTANQIDHTGTTDRRVTGCGSRGNGHTTRAAAADLTDHSGIIFVLRYLGAAFHQLTVSCVIGIVLRYSLLGYYTGRAIGNCIADRVQRNCTAADHINLTRVKKRIVAACSSQGDDVICRCTDRTDVCRSVGVYVFSGRLSVLIRLIRVSTVIMSGGSRTGRDVVERIACRIDGHLTANRANLTAALQCV